MSTVLLIALVAMILRSRTKAAFRLVKLVDIPLKCAACDLRLLWSRPDARLVDVDLPQTPNAVSKHALSAH